MVFIVANYCAFPRLDNKSYLANIDDVGGHTPLASESRYVVQLVAKQIFGPLPLPEIVTLYLSVMVALPRWSCTASD